MDPWNALFGSPFLPHGHCYLWRPDILWLNVGSDAIVAAAYYAIPVALVALARARRHLFFSRLFWMFAAFIFLCGTTHVFAIWTVWHGDYLAAGLVKAATAGASLATAALVWPALPRLLAIPSPDALERANADLRREIAERERAERDLRRARGELEERVVERTRALGDANAALHREIADRERAESQLRLALEALPNGTVMVRADGAIAFANRAAEQIFGYARGALVDRPIESLLPERLRGAHRAHRARFAAAPSTRAMGAGRDLYALRADGDEVPVEIGLSPLATPEGAFVLGSIVDITERKRAEERIAASLREKEILLREVHHRVKNNLQVLTSLLRLQIHHSPEAESALAETESRVRAIALLHEKLYLSPDLAELDAASYVRDVARALARQHGVSDARIRVEVRAEDVPLDVDRAIPCGLIVNELVSNAFEHAFADGRAGTISVRLARHDAHTLVLAVADDGVGLPAEVDVASPPTLGLRLVATLAHQIGGELVVARDGGARFEVRFPAPPQEESTACRTS
ncbi:MAG: histidine kinase dimerization/phosphoacceptor domain -containing protein [Myxococcota bacterium]